MGRPINDRQLDVLRWIGDGCPSREWPDQTYKNTAAALKSRHLVAISRKGGRWSAEITPEGEYYLEHDAYPPKPGSASTSRATPRPQRGAQPAPSVAERVEENPGGTEDPTEWATPLGPNAPTAAQRLLIALLAADGRLLVRDESRDSPLREQITEIAKSGWLPPGLRIHSAREGWRQALLTLRPDAQALIAPAATLTVPQRLTKAHPAIKAFRENRDEQYVSASSLGRASRLLHALATAIEATGMTFASLKPVGSRRGRGEGQFVITDANGFREVLSISEKSAPGGDQLPHYFSNQWKNLPAWVRRRQKQFIPTGQLTITLGGQYGRRTGGRSNFNDGKRHQLEDVLGDVVRELEISRFDHAEDLLEDQRKEADRQRRWNIALAKAKDAALETHRAKVLKARALALEDWRRLNDYLTHMTPRINDLPEPQRHQVTEWLNWAARHIAETDPIRTNHLMPDPPTWTREHLEPHLRGWSGPWLPIGN